MFSFGHLWMASCIPNSVSFQGWKTSPYCLFGWNIGRKRVDDKPQTKYHDIDLTFSTSLLDKTFLKGITSPLRVLNYYLQKLL